MNKDIKLNHFSLAYENSSKNSHQNEKHTTQPVISILWVYIHPTTSIFAVYQLALVWNIIIIIVFNFMTM